MDWSKPIMMWQGQRLVKAYWTYPGSGFRRSIIWAIDYMNKQQSFDEEILAILEDMFCMILIRQKTRERGSS